MAAYERLAARIKNLGGDPGRDVAHLARERRAADCDADPAEHRRAGQGRGSGGDRHRRPAAGHAPLSSSRAKSSGRPRRWRTAFRRAWSGVIPAEAVTRQGIEYRVEVRDAAGRTASAPSGPPGAAWSASGLDLPPPAVFHEPAPAAAGQVSDLTAEAGADYEVVLHWTPPVGCAGCLVTRNVEGKAAVAVPTRLAEFIDLYPVPGATVRYAVAALDAQGKPGPAAVAETRIAAQSPPPKVEGLKAVPGPSNARLTWRPIARKLSGYQLLRRAAGGEARPVAAAPLQEESLLDVGLDSAVDYTYQVCAVDRAGQCGELSAPATVRPLAHDLTRKRGPVFHVAFEGNGDAGPIKPKAVGVVRFAPGIVGKALDSRRGGCFVYPHRKDFELDGEFAIELWFHAETLDREPVLASCGEYAKNGWFVQIFGGQIRFSLGGANVLDAGPISVGQVASPRLHLRRADDARLLGRQGNRRPRGVQRGFHALDRSPVRGPVSLPGR